MKLESKKTLLILTPGFPASEDDSSCLPPIQMMCRALRDELNGSQIIVITFQYPFENSSYTWEGIQVIALGGKNKKSIWKIITWLKAWHTIKKISRSNPSIGLLSFWAKECYFIGNLYSKRFGIKHYNWVLGQDAKPGNKYLQWLKPDAQEFLAHSKLTAKRLKENYSLEMVKVVEGGLYKEGLIDLTPVDRTIDIIGVGSLIQLKNFSLFITIIHQLKLRYPNISAVIVGEGPYRATLLEQIKKLDLENNVQLIGSLKHNLVLNQMAQCKVLLHTSDYESGNVTVVSEAIYAGCQVVCFNHHIQSRDENIHIVNDQKEMLQKILALLAQNLDYSIGKTTVDMTKSAQMILDLYKQ